MWENIKMAALALWAHKLRAFLTMFGIIIGVSSVIIIVFIAQAGATKLKSQIIGEGNTIDVIYQPSDPYLMDDTASPFTESDINALSNIPEIDNILSTALKIDSIRFRNTETEAPILGIDKAFMNANNVDIIQGIPISSPDFSGGNRVAIVSSSIQDDLFEGESIVGEIIYINDVPIKIIGMFKEPQGMFNSGLSMIYMPSNTMKKIYGQIKYDQLTLQVNNINAIDEVGRKAENILNRINNTEDTYQVLNIEEIASGIDTITNIMGALISGVSAITIIVGGVGVMNIMLVSVRERTREIGIRKSLGATRKQILLQFLIESVIITGLGGIIGLLVGMSLSYLIAYFLNLPFVISWPILLSALFFSAIIGILFGFIPADKASKLSPIKSLRYE